MKTNPTEPRAALALLEAILPGSERIPAADESTLARVMDVLAKLPAPARVGFDAATRLLDAAALPAIGKPFHALDRASQEALLRSWPSTPVLGAALNLLSHFFAVVHFDRDDVYQGLGGTWNVVGAVEQPPYLSQIQDAGELTEPTLECDVVVVGTGAGGAVVGKELAARGHAVLFVEQGQRHGRDEFDGRSVDAHFKFYWPTLTVGNAPMPLLMGRMMGGSTAINGGSCYRTPAKVLERWCEDIGTDELSPERMRAHFERVERTIEVAPAPKRTVGPFADVLARGCDALGLAHGPVLRNAPGCDGLGFCDFGCRTGARKSMDVSYIPLAIRHGAKVLTGLRADAIAISNGKAVGIDATALATGRRVHVRARRVVLAGGGIHSPAFLLRQGLAGSSGHLGRHLAVQPSSGFAALVDDRIDGPKHTPQGHHVSELIDEGILIAGGLPDYNFAPVVFALHGQRLMDAVDRIEHTIAFALLTRDSAQPGRVRVGPGGRTLVTYDIAPDDVRRMHRAVCLTAEICLAAGARRLYPQIPSMPIIEAKEGLRALREAKLGAGDMQWIAYHPVGTCKMGKDPRSSVVDLAHECHDVPNLHVVDGSTVPGPLGVNPQITIMSMATRAAGLIDQRLS